MQIAKSIALLGTLVMGKPSFLTSRLETWPKRAVICVQCCGASSPCLPAGPIGSGSGWAKDQTMVRLMIGDCGMNVSG